MQFIFKVYLKQIQILIKIILIVKIKFVSVKLNFLNLTNNVIIAYFSVLLV
jgi:hypothetical protein